MMLPSTKRPLLLIALCTVLVSGEREENVTGEFFDSDDVPARSDMKTSTFTTEVSHSTHAEASTVHATPFNSTKDIKSDKQYALFNGNVGVPAKDSLFDELSKVGNMLQRFTTNLSSNETSHGIMVSKLDDRLPGITAEESSHDISLSAVLSTLGSILPGLTAKDSSNKISLPDILSTLGNVLPGMTTEHSSNKVSLSDILSSLGIKLPDMLPLISVFLPKTKCQSDLMYAVLSAVSGERWALQMFDSWGKPYSLLRLTALQTVGDYDQCRNTTAPSKEVSRPARYRGNYCVVSVGPAGLGNQVEGRSVFQLEFGTCMPDTCSEQEITHVSANALRAFNLSTTLNIGGTDCRTDYREFTPAGIIAIVLLCVIGFLMLVGTVLDIAVVQRPSSTSASTQNTPEESQSQEVSQDRHRREADDKMHVHSQAPHWKRSVIPFIDMKISGPITDNGLGDSNNENNSLTENRKHGNLSQGVIRKFFLSFSVYTNGSNLLTSKQSPEAMTAINGIRLLSMFWVVICHVVITGVEFRSHAADFYRHLVRARVYDFLINGTHSVDTFFAISGLLSSYYISKEMEKKGWKLKWHKILLHRFWRLTPPYMLAFVMIWGLTDFMGSGPMWFGTEKQVRINCEKYWWTHLLYINNLVRPLDMCGARFWYLAVDMQFFVILPIMIIPFYFNIYAGLGSCIFLLLVNWITVGILSVENNWTTNLARSSLAALFDPSEESLEPLKSSESYYKYFYVFPFSRIGPYVIGVLAGKFLAVTNRRFKLRWYAVVLFWIGAAAMGLALIYGTNDLAGTHFTRDTAALYSAVSRTAWGIFICWVIVACDLGYGGPVNIFLSWTPFTVLSRLTYMMYLIHTVVLVVHYENMEQVAVFTNISFAIVAMGTNAAVVLLSFILVLSFESPFVKMEKIFLS